MDANKLKVLQDINYTIRKTCGNCEHAFLNTRDTKGIVDFGLCTIQFYNHEKHTNSKRELSINEYGYCSKHKWEYNTKNVLHGVAELMEK